jgi:hypothetical protein
LLGNGAAERIYKPAVAVSQIGSCTYLVQRSADDHSSICLYSVVVYFLFFSLLLVSFLFFIHSYTTFAEYIDTDRK